MTMAVNDGGFGPETMTGGLTARERELSVRPSGIEHAEVSSDAATTQESDSEGGFDPIAKIFELRMWLNQIFRE